MKKIIKILFGLHVFCLMLTFTACENYLEFPPVLEFNEDSVFTQRTNVEKYLSTMYTYNVNQMPFASTRLDRSLLDAASDIGCGYYAQSAYGAHQFNKGTVAAEWVSNNSLGEDRFGYHYKAIRIGWKLLQRTDEVPDATQAQKDRIKGEAKAMIAMHYFELMKRYGGVPLAKKFFVTTEESAIPRSSLEDTYKYIVQLCDEVIAMPDFPAIITDRNDFGRASKAMAMGIKARTLLYMASPLFNSDRPYMDNLGTNSNLICLMKYDKELWKTAADEIKATIDTCELYGMKLTNVGDVTKNFTAAYQYLPSKGNTEIIMPYILTGVYTDYGNFVNWKPRGAPFNGYSSNLPTQNFVEMFQLKDGTYRNWDTDTITPINKPTYPYDNLDPRFKQLIAYNGEVLPELPTATLQIWDAENGNIANGGVNGKRGNAQFAYYLTKYIYGYLNNTSYTSPNQWRPFTPYMRLTEMYLNLAEALNEYYGDEDSKPVADVYARVNTIRARSGMPALNESLINTKAKMRVQIQKERAIELGFEDSRFFDLKRWKMGDTFKGPIYDLKVTKKNNGQYTYKKYIYETRPWFEHYYLHPFPPSEVNKLKGIIQNPGW
ncbi:RagB/SusD family nutrient uptake outer membrane protein [Parabacteroides sp. FAFU027]|uniref:RagB/SusD family nutrient uptake outer membrane protein n=1 Tax=Parabacteroides sp. FAFU027 TaxID=2922715 RepID=UPI001FAF98D7|nr:RagB/SusD family nutrient uptake outer membrane protein [Parabacteroides sp. FAFU027]